MPTVMIISPNASNTQQHTAETSE